MSPSLYSFLFTIVIAPLAALVGGIVVVLRTQNIAFGVIAGVVGLAVGLVVGYLIAVFWLWRWPTEYDPVDSEQYQRALREHGGDFESWPDAIATMIVSALFFGGTISALVVTLLVGWLLSG